MFAGYVCILNRACMRLMLAILRSANRAVCFLAVAIMRFALLIRYTAVSAGYVCFLILIRRNGTVMRLMRLAPLRPAARTGDITAAGTVVLLVLTIIFLTMTAFGIDAAACMVSLVLAILRPAMITVRVDAAAVVRFALLV